MRISVRRHDPDGSDIEGTAEVVRKDLGISFRDVRDLDGEPLGLPVGSNLLYDWPDHTEGET